MKGLLHKFKSFFKHRLPYKLIEISPNFLSKRFMARSISLVRNLSEYEGIEIKIADTKEELNAALKLTQDVYLESQLTKEKENMKRVLKYNLLPTTIVFVAKKDEEVIGTMSVICDSTMGLPIQEYSSIDQFRKKQSRLGEFTGLAIKRGWRRTNKKVYGPLVFYSIRIIKDVLKIDYCFAITNYSGYIFYQNLFGSKKLERKKTHYNGLMNAEAYPSYMEIQKNPYNFNNYPLKDGTNLQDLYFQFPWENLVTTHIDEHNGIYTKKRMSTYYQFYLEHFEYFSSQLTDNDIIYLNNIYNQDETLEVLKFNDGTKANSRQSTRFLVDFEVINHSNSSFDVIDISKTGLRLLKKEESTFSDVFRGIMKSSKGEISIELKMVKAWENLNYAGYRLIEVDIQKWNQLMEHISDRKPQITQEDQAA